MLPEIKVNVAELFKGEKGLPPLPEVVTKLQEMIRNDAVDIKKVTEMVTSDVSLVTQILKIVNSAYYSLSREVSNLRFAIAYLGINEIYRIVLSLSVVSSFKLQDPEGLKEFWHHSFYTALCTKKLAKKHARYEEGEDLWSSALLHDVGKLVYMKYFPEHYAALKKYAREQQCYFSEAEKHFGVPSSSFFGVRLCDYWQLPKQIKDACQYHTLEDLRNLDQTDSRADFYRIICLGNLFSQFSGDHLSDKKRQETSAVIIEKLGYTQTEFLADVADTQALKFDVEEFMQQLT